MGDFGKIKNKIEMKKIELTKGYETIVDEEDYVYLCAWNWKAQVGKTGNVYAETSFVGKTKRTLMQRLIMEKIKGCPLAPGEEIYHKDHNTLNNQRENLILVSRKEINLGKRLDRRNKSGYKGVSWYNSRNKWQSVITANGKQYFLGHFIDKHEAARAYNQAALELHGEFAVLNNINDQAAPEDPAEQPQNNKGDAERTLTSSNGLVQTYKRKPATNKSGYKGVSWSERGHKWRAMIHYKDKLTGKMTSRSLGSYVDQADATRAYNKAASEIFGEKAILNPITACFIMIGHNQKKS